MNEGFQFMVFKSFNCFMVFESLNYFMVSESLNCFMVFESLHFCFYFCWPGRISRSLSLTFIQSQVLVTLEGSRFHSAFAWLSFSQTNRQCKIISRKVSIYSRQINVVNSKSYVIYKALFNFFFFVVTLSCQVQHCEIVPYQSKQKTVLGVEDFLII